MRFFNIDEGKRMNVAPPRIFRMASVRKRVCSGEEGIGEDMVIERGG